MSKVDLSSLINYLKEKDTTISTLEDTIHKLNHIIEIATDYSLMCIKDPIVREDLLAILHPKAEPKDILLERGKDE